MELIKEALKKAKASGGVNPAAKRRSGSQLIETPPAEWSPPRVVVDPVHLDTQRIVSYGLTDPSHLAFNLLRTKIFRIMKGNRWSSLAIISPTAGCGKTTVSLNLGFSLARQSNCRTVLIDLDFKKAAMATALGIQPKNSIGEYLEGKVSAEECFLQVTDNFFVGLNAQGKKLSSELLHEEQKLNELMATLKQHLRPDIVLFDLPPMLSTDDAIAFLPRVDCSLLIIAAGATTAIEVDECERQASAAGHYLGIVLNKCRSSPTDYYQYDY